MTRCPWCTLPRRQASIHEIVNLVAAIGGGAGWYGGFDGWNESPVRCVFCTLLDPLRQQFLLGTGERFPLIGRWHPQIFVGGGNSFDQQTGRGIEGNNCAVIDGGIAIVQPQIGLPRFFVGPVTRETVPRENGPDLAVEGHFLVIVSGRYRCPERRKSGDRQ